MTLWPNARRRREQGVAAGQLITVTVGLLVLMAVGRFAAARLRTLQVGAAYVVGSIAAFWMIQRALA